MPRSVNPDLVTLLNGNTNFLMADLYTVTLVSGTVLRWTSLDMPLVSGGQIFTPAGTGDAPIIERSSWELSIGLNVDTLDITLHTGTTARIDGVPLALQAMNGALDAATVKLERAFMKQWGFNTTGTVELFVGDVSAIDASSTKVQLKVNSVLGRLNVQMPRNLFLPSCSRLLYDAGCTLSKAAFTFAGTVAAGGSVTTLAAQVSLGKPAGYFETGIVAITSGAVAGARRGVASYDGTTFVLSTPLPSIPAAGDAFIAIAGCDRTLPTCTNRFNNKPNFRGFKDIPVAETSL
jgi:uncharacterized phage protein (TIGR02218 family)